MSKYTEKTLKFESKEAFYLACETAGLTYKGEVAMESSDYGMVEVGVKYKETGVTITSEDGSEYPEMEPIPGYYVKLRQVKNIGLGDFEV